CVVSLIVCVSRIVFHFTVSFSFPYSLFSYLFSFNTPSPSQFYTLSYTTLFRSQYDRNVTLVLPPHCPQTDLHPNMSANKSRSPRSKSTRLNSSHVSISYAVFCLKKKKKKTSRAPGITNY